jgi:hypothetical protein
MSTRWFGLAVGVAPVLWLYGACSVYTEELLEPEASGGRGGSGATANGGGNGASDSSGGLDGGEDADPMGGGAGSAGTGNTGNTGNAGNGGNGGGGGLDGGEDSTGATAGNGGGPDVVTTPPTLIDDMEDGNRSITRVDGRTGVWFLSGDDTEGAMMTPSTPSLITMSNIPEPRGDSMRALHFSGSGFEDWGAQIGFNFTSGRTPYDVSRYAGLRFHVALGPDPAEGTGDPLLIRINVPTIQTDPYTDEAMPDPLCDDAPSAPEADMCFDHWGTDLLVDGAWTEVALSFDDMGQLGFGRVADFDKENALQIIFQVAGAPGGNSFDFWIDDISFVEL